jgi:hypothetical protein
MDVVGEEFDAWRNAFRFNQGYELQSSSAGRAAMRPCSTLP